MTSPVHTNLILFLLIFLGGIKVDISWEAVLTMFMTVGLLDLGLAAAAVLTFRRERLVAIGP